MGRSRSFDETELLEAMMIAFWRHGYSATTYRSLETLTGVGIKSLANAFGDKDELFASVLARYRQRATDTLAAVFDPPSVDAIIRVFQRLSAPVAEDDVCNSGCLMVNTVFEIEEPAEPINQEIAQFRELWRSTFQRALEADGVTDAETKAEFLVGALWGALSQIRLSGSTTAAQPMTSVIVDTIQSWTQPPADAN